MSAHTPGPWTACEPTKELHAVRAASARMVANVGYSGSVDTDIANARLIAAAPELLEALKDMVSYVENLSSDYPTVIDTDSRWVAAARTAIDAADSLI